MNIHGDIYLLLAAVKQIEKQNEMLLNQQQDLKAQSKVVFSRDRATVY